MKMTEIKMTEMIDSPRRCDYQIHDLVLMYRLPCPGRHSSQRGEVLEESQSVNRVDESLAILFLRPVLKTL